MIKGIQKILLLVFAAALSLLVYAFFAGMTAEKDKGYAIELGEDGFSPAEISIQKGDTVVFFTTQKKPFWPASNLHPSHTLYPEFDAREPIDPSQSWSFTFERPGEWYSKERARNICQGVEQQYREFCHSQIRGI